MFVLIKTEKKTTFLALLRIVFFVVAQIFTALLQALGKVIFINAANTVSAIFQKIM